LHRSPYSPWLLSCVLGLLACDDHHRASSPVPISLDASQVVSPPDAAQDKHVQTDAGTGAADEAGSARPQHLDAGSDGGLDGDAALARECAEPPAPPIDPRQLALCPDCSGQARCVPRALITGQASQLADELAACDRDSVCIPDPIIATMGFYKPDTCRSLHDSEGRCLSECLPQVASRRDILPQAGCADHERCVPCFDPIDGGSTGACDLPCDTGPTESARPFDACCAGAGLCLPKALVPSAQRTALGADTCTESGALCAPRLFAEPTGVPARCDSIGGGEGRCLPSCMPAVAKQADLLPQDRCDSGERCAPCFDPITGKDTQVCRLHGDAPREPALVFDTACCGQGGLCIPSALASADAQGPSLPVDRCADAVGEGWLCAPKRVVTDPSRASNPFDSCKIDLGLFSVGHGKCVPNCMVTAKGWVKHLLSRSGCDSGESCVPCSAGGVPGC
jgi:hypothetical protein